MAAATTPKRKQQIRRAIIDAVKNKTFSLRRIMETLKTSEITIRRIINNDSKLKTLVKQYTAKKAQTNNTKKPEQPSKSFEVNGGKAQLTLVTRLHFKNVDEILEYGKVDVNIWQPYKHILNSWDVTIKDANDEPETVTNWQCKVWLQRKSPSIQSLQTLLDEIKSKSPVIIKRNRAKLLAGKPQRELELSLYDPHIGLRCLKPSADSAQTPESACQLFLQIGERLLNYAKKYGPFERIIYPFGHDFFHTDYVYNTTTTGTFQPEADAWKHTLLLGEKLALSWIKQLSKMAPVKVVVVPGNHARHTEILMGRVLKAYFHNDKNIEVDCELCPYKFHQYGVNLIGFEHGHSIRQTVRLAALMANECRLNGWSDARYCEWHLGDQHRKGSSKPSVMEEQGASVEYLPGLTVPNEWHKIHSFNWQKRAGMAFVWDKKAGPIARLQVNIDNYTGKVMQ